MRLSFPFSITASRFGTIKYAGQKLILRVEQIEMVDGKGTRDGGRDGGRDRRRSRRREGRDVQR